MTLAESVGWVLVHFIWQGAAIAGALWLVLALTPPARATLRYAWGCGALVLMLAAPIVTASQVVRAPSRADAWTAPSAASAIDATIQRDEAAGLSRERAREGPSAPAIDRGAGASTIPPSAAGPTTTLAWPLTASMRARVAAALPWLVVVWAVGVMLLSVRLAGGWWRTRSLRTHGISPVTASCQQAAARVMARMRVTRPVVFLVSARVLVPIVFGHLKPVVLLPAAVLAGLSPSQLEAVLAHELAHVRRHDYLVNLVQTVIETLLFYHPAVWWASQQVRVAREHCCDDMAVTACGDRKGYVEALLGLEQIRHASPLMALGVADGPLLARARRILSDGEREGTSPRLAASVIAMAVAALAMASISTASDEPIVGKTSIDEVGVPESIAAREPSEETAASARGGGHGAPAQPRPVIAAADQTGTLASRRAWAEREARTQRAPRYWLGYAIRPGKALPPLVYLDRHGMIVGDRMQFSGHFLSRRAEGLLFPGRPLAIADADPAAIKLLFAFDLSGGAPRLTDVHGSTLALPVGVKDLPVFWLGSVETAPSLEMIDGLYGSASTAELKKELVATAAVHDDSPTVVAWLDRRVRSGDPVEVRAEAAEWLAWHPIQASLTALERAARQDGASRVRQEAAEALGDLALPQAADVLIALAKSLDDRNARQEAVEALGARPELSARDALGAIARQDADLDIQREAVETLGDYKDQRGLPLLVDLMRTHPRPEIRREAIETIGDAMPDDAAVGLLRQAALEDADPGVQGEAVDTLAQLDRADARAAVMDLARSHPRREVRREAVEALAEAWHGDQPTAGSDAARHRENVLALLAELAEQDRDRDVQLEAVESLGEVKDPKALERLRALARTHAQADVRREALETLVEDAAAADAVTLLREIIQQETDAGARVSAVERLADIQDPAATTELVNLARTHASEDIRAEAVETLGDVLPSPEIVDLLKKVALEDKSPRVRNEAIETLADLSDGAGVPALVELARTHSDPDARREALEALVDSNHPRAREIFERALQKPSGR